MNRFYQQQVLVVALGLLFCVAGQTVDQKRLQAIEASMGVSRKPCDDFFKYACEGWAKYKGFPSYDTENIHIMDKRLESELDDLFQHKSLKSGVKFMNEIYNYYQSCVDLDSGHVQHLEYLKWLSAHEGIQWPLVATNNSAGAVAWQWSWDWIEMLATLRKFGFNDMFIYEDVVSRKDNPLQMTVELKRPPLDNLDDFDTQTEPLDDILDNNAKNVLKHFQVDLFLLTTDWVERNENNSIEHSLKNPSDAESTLISLSELQMPWLNKYLGILLNEAQVDPNMKVYVQSVDYLKTIYDFVSRHDNKLVCDYIQAKFLVFLREQDPHNFYSMCTRSIRHNLPLAMQWIHRTTHPELQQQTPLIAGLFQNLKTKFRSNLQANAYNFSPDIKQYLLAKVDKLQLKIFDVTSEDLDKYYQQLSLTTTDYYGNRLNINKFKFNVAHAAITKPSPLGHSLVHLERREVDYDKDSIQQTTLSSLAYFYAGLNTVYLPLTLLQDPFYEHGWGDVYTYSSIGFQLAREIAKAFDHHHVGIDANGIYNPVMYSKIITNPKFHKSTEKQNKDFEEFLSVDAVVDDLNGLKLAYETFADLHRDVLSKSMATLHKTTKTTEQVFFLNYAQNFCSVGCHKSTMGIFNYDHCQRVDVPVKHFAKFRDAFQCNAVVSQDKAHPLWG